VAMPASGGDTAMAAATIAVTASATPATVIAIIDTEA
jgi:hypothetical protein